MNDILTVRELFEEMGASLDLSWVAGRSAASRGLRQTPESGNNPTLIGHLNLIQPNRVQVLGRTELRYVSRQGELPGDETIKHLFSRNTNAIIIADDQSVPPEFVQSADERGVSLFTTPLASHEIITKLRYYLARELAERIILHGVFLEVMSVGVLITGEASVGKSELALELITRGHRLIADDAPEIRRISPDTLEGRCPPVLQDFLEVRGLGILNIRQMYGDASIKRQKYLRLIIHLRPLTDESLRKLDRISGEVRTTRLLGVEITETTLPVAPGRNLGVMVEAAVRNFLLQESGYNAASDMMDRQERLMGQ